MKNPTKSEKLKWTREAAKNIAKGRERFTCNAFESVHWDAMLWYRAFCKKVMRRNICVSDFETPYGSDGKQYRLMWLCFLITLIEHGEPELTDL